MQLGSYLSQPEFESLSINLNLSGSHVDTDLSAMWRTFVEFLVGHSDAQEANGWHFSLHKPRERFCNDAFHTEF
jgi:hypothetical protein